MDHRLAELNDWLIKSLSLKVDSIEPASEDASFRRYFRVTVSDNSNPNTYIAMDAPPAQESLTEFIAIDQALALHHLHTPKIFFTNIEKGFLLLEDLGNRTYLNELSDSSSILYNDAINALISLQSLKKSTIGGFLSPENRAENDLLSTEFAAYIPPSYDQNLIEQELDLFVTWYCERHLNITLSAQQLAVWADLKQHLIGVFAEQPQAWVHRDYHSRNLMITNDNSPGIIDFQDMVWGPIGYDVVSLFKDCYIEWPRTIQLNWLATYHTKYTSQNNVENVEFEQLVQWFDLTGLQRHLKVLGIFCRLNYRDNKSHYLLDLPLVEKYVHEVLDLYPELNSFKQLFLAVSHNK